MLTMPKITSLGGALDAVGRAAAPSAPASLSRPAPQTTTTACDDMAAVFGTPRTVEEANHRRRRHGDRHPDGWAGSRAAKHSRRRAALSVRCTCAPR